MKKIIEVGSSYFKFGDIRSFVPKSTSEVILDVIKEARKLHREDKQTMPQH